MKIKNITRLAMLMSVAGMFGITGAQWVPFSEASTMFAGALMLVLLAVGTVRALQKQKAQEKAFVPVKIS